MRGRRVELPSAHVGYNLIVMIAAILILAQLAGPLIPFVPSPAAREDSAPVRCCCCPADACNCGCEVPAVPAESDEEQTPDRSRFCACDDTPLGLPNAPQPAPERPGIVSILPAVQMVSVASKVLVGLLGHWPHGPPPDIPLLATIVLLN